MAIRFATAIDRRRRIRRAVMHMEAELLRRPDARLSVAELADVACMSPYHFIRRFRHAVGDPPEASVRKLRMQLARTMLASQSTTSVTNVALTFGYESPAAFGRAYRRTLGATPSTDSLAGAPAPAVTSTLVQSPSVELQAMHLERSDTVWRVFDELLAHLDVGAVPRHHQDMYAELSPEGRVERAGVRANGLVRNAVRLEKHDAGVGVHVKLEGQPKAVWSALDRDERLHRLRRDNEPLLLRYLNDPGYCTSVDQRIALFVPLMKGARWPAK